MQTVTNQIKQSMAGSSWIRKMFEKGLELKKRYGADAVCDFSLGNPDVPPPAKTKEVLEGLAAKAIERNTGARGLRSILEETMTDIMFRLPSQKNVAKVVITADCVNGTGEPVIEKK